uniref:Uncharacterized protein n=1 Tax=Oryza glumipatula TaxID=40148 RepID=A0A0E0AZK8_9ORYZ
MVLYKQLTTSNGIRLLDTKIKKFMDKFLTMQEHRTKVASRRAQRDETTWFARCASLLSLALAMVVAPARSRLKPGDNNEEDLVLTVAPLRSVDESPVASAEASSRRHRRRRGIWGRIRSLCFSLSQTRLPISNSEAGLSGTFSLRAGTIAGY